MTSRLQSALIIAVTAVLLSSTTDALAQGLPPPTTTRAPLLTRLPADSIRRQVTYLKLMQLLQDLRQGPTPALDVDASDLVWSAADQAARTNPSCTTLRTVIFALRSHLGTGALPASLPIFFDQTQVIDTQGGDTAVVHTSLIIDLATSSMSSAVALTYNHPQARWISATGLLAALCAAATTSTP